METFFVDVFSSDNGNHYGCDARTEVDKCHSCYYCFYDGGGCYSCDRDD